MNGPRCKPQKTRCPPDPLLSSHLVSTNYCPRLIELALPIREISAVRHPGSHPTVMPEALAEICVRAGSRLGDVVLDPFCGTGTTGAAAIRLGRKFVGIDLLRHFVDKARHRLHEVTVSGSG